MKQILKTIYVGGSRATLECETHTEVLEYTRIGSTVAHKVPKSQPLVYRVVVEYEYNKIDFALDTYYDSPEPWRKPLIEPPAFFDDQLLQLLDGERVDWYGGYEVLTIADQCERTKLRFGYWLDDRVDFELTKMKSVL